MMLVLTDYLRFQHSPAVIASIEGTLQRTKASVL